MDTSYKPDRSTPTAEQHSDAKEVNDLINALVDGDANIAKEAIEAVLALTDDFGGGENALFMHLYKVFNAVLDNQLLARFIEPQE